MCQSPSGGRHRNGRNSDPTFVNTCVNTSADEAQLISSRLTSLSDKTVESLMDAIIADVKHVTPHRSTQTFTSLALNECHYWPLMIFRCHNLCQLKALSSMATRMKTRSQSKRDRIVDIGSHVSPVESLSTSPKTSKYFIKRVNKGLKKLANDETIKNKKSRQESKSQLQSETAVIEPKNWKTILNNIRKMRSQKEAVVDAMGAEKTFDRNEGDPKNKRFQVLVSLMLSSQTRDEITYKTMQSLREFGLTVDNIIKTSEEHLRELIHSVSFFNNKAKFIKKTALILREQFDGDIPGDLKGLLGLPGVGPKMAHLAMLIAWDQCTGIAVDTHVHRICNRLQWTKSKTPEETQKQLEQWFPKDLWPEINLLLVGFGQTICSPLRPKCTQCLNQKICPFASQLEF